MTLRKVAWVTGLAMLLAPVVLLARQNILKNGSMEFGQGPGAIDPAIPLGWTLIGGPNIERSGAFNFAPPGAGHSLKAFGDPDHNYVAGFQEVLNIDPNQQVYARVYLYSPGDDRLIGSGQAGLRLEFVDTNGGTIQRNEVYPLNASSPANTWILAALGPYSAPEYTVRVRVSCRLTWTPNDVWGAAYWDDAALTVNGGLDKLANGNFEIAGPSPGQSTVGIDEWTGFEDQEKSDDFAEDQEFSVKLGASELYSGLYQNMRPLEDGDHLYLLAYVWNPSADPLVSTSRAGVKLEFDPWGGNPPPPEELLSFDQDDPNDTWVLITYATTVPTDATLARIVMIADEASATNGPIYFDSASAVRGGGGGNQLANPSFELGPGGPGGLTNWVEFGTEGECTARKSTFEVPAQQGNATLKISGSCVAGVYQEILVTSGETLTISAYLRTKSTDPFNDEQGPRAGVKVEWVLGNVPPDVDIGGATNTITAGSPQNTWIPLYLDYTMPENSYALVRFTNLIEKGDAMTGHVYFDSCEAVVLNKFDGSDVDGDDDEDLYDFAWFQRTFTGSDGGMRWNGIVFNSDDDDDVDFVDFNYFAPRMTGPLP